MSGIQQFRQVLSSALDRANRLPVEEHARLAHCAGGPSLAELEAKIRQLRGIPAVTAALAA